MEFKLPPEILLNVLDQLVGSPLKQTPIFDPSNPITRTLRALTLTSRFIYPIATRYLYRYCLCIKDCASLACLRRTLGADLGSHHPQSLDFGQAGRNEELWGVAKTSQHMTSIFISPMEMSDTRSDLFEHTSVARLPQVVDLCKIIGPTLKRLLLYMQPVFSSHSELEARAISQQRAEIFPGMINLEELVASYDIMEYFHLPPPNLKRLAITAQEIVDVFMEFCFSSSTLQTLVFLRPVELTAADINRLISAYKGRSLDIVLVDVNSNHRTPENTRDWSVSDTVRIWEADVPTSFYGDDDDLFLCDNWIWTHAVDGTLWIQEKRRMASWSEIQRRLAGPVHQIVENF